MTKERLKQVSLLSFSNNVNKLFQESAKKKVKSLYMLCIDSQAAINIKCRISIMIFLTILGNKKLCLFLFNTASNDTIIYVDEHESLHESHISGTMWIKIKWNNANCFKGESCNAFITKRQT